MLGAIVTVCLFLAATVLSGVGIGGVWCTRRDIARDWNCAWFGVLGLLGIVIGVLGVCHAVSEAQLQQEIYNLREYIRRA